MTGQLSLNCSIAINKVFFFFNLSGKALLSKPSAVFKFLSEKVASEPFTNQELAADCLQPERRRHAGRCGSHRLCMCPHQGGGSSPPCPLLTADVM